MPGRVAGRRQDLDEFVEPVRAADEIGAAGFDHRHDAFAKCSEFRRRGRGIADPASENNRNPAWRRHSGHWESRLPAAVLQLRVPAEMIVMQMRAHHHVDLVRPRARGGEPVEPRRIEHVPPRPHRPRFLIAAAGVDQDFAAIDLQQPAMDAELEFAACRIVVIRREPMAVLGKMRVGQAGKISAGCRSADRSPRSA